MKEFFCYILLDLLKRIVGGIEQHIGENLLRAETVLEDSMKEGLNHMAVTHGGERGRARE